MRADWIWRRGDGAARAALRGALSPLGWLYGSVAGLHRGLYRSGLLRARKLGVGVVSVGNLVVGGTGKTPLAGWVA
ncbi:MAG: tetraacyldisaccharide 4'-kinase, partial [Myxococcota bacterium]